MSVDQALLSRVERVRNLENTDTANILVQVYHTAVNVLNFALKTKDAQMAAEWIENVQDMTAELNAFVDQNTMQTKVA